MSLPSTAAPMNSYQAHAAFWRLPITGLSSDQRARLEAGAITLNSGRHGSDVAKLPLTSMIAHAATLDMGPDADASSLRFLALSRLSRTNLYQHYSPYRMPNTKQPAPLPTWFHLDKPSAHLGLLCIKRRKGTAAKAMLSAGCHPALFFCSTWDATDLPSPASAASALIALSAQSSLDACKTLFNALDSSCSDPAIFREAVAHAAREALRGVWTEREGVANMAEQTAVAKCSFAFERLAKKKSLPKDLQEAAVSVAAKRASFSDDDDAHGAAFEFSAIQIQRMKALSALYSTDDLQGFAALAPLCGLTQAEAFETGVPESAGLDWPAGKYWGTKLASKAAFACAAYLFDQGENPWLCSGDGTYGPAADGNPFTWALAHARHAPSSERPGFPAFASAVAHAALRDAESRHPSHGLALCLEAFEVSRSARARMWSDAGSGGAIVLAACEQALFPSMMAADALDAHEAHEEPKTPVVARSQRL
jgi:hypothetical protein